jgi:hypothetical protein
MTVADAPDLSYSSASGRWVLAVSVLGSGIAALDATVVSIALPTCSPPSRSPTRDAWIAALSGPSSACTAGSMRLH